MGRALLDNVCGDFTYYYPEHLRNPTVNALMLAFTVLMWGFWKNERSSSSKYPHEPHFGAVLQCVYFRVRAPIVC